MEQTEDSKLKDRLGAFIHHPLTSLIVVVLILVSVGLVMVHLTLDPGHPAQQPIELIQVVITFGFVFELSVKYYVAESKSRYFAQYWVDIIAIIPWAQSLRVLRVLRLLRVFRVAMILSRRVRFVSALFRSAIGEYIVLALIMLILLGVGTFALYVSETRAHQDRRRQRLSDVDKALVKVEHKLRLRETKSPSGGVELKAGLPTRRELVQRLAQVEARLAANLDAGKDPNRTRLLSREVTHLRSQLPPVVSGVAGDGDLSDLENSFWATLFFLVATEPMIGVPQTTVGRAIVLVVMFGGLTTFAIFTGIITALMVNRLKRRMEIDDMDRFHLNDHMIICGWNRLVPLIIEELNETPGHPDMAVVVVADLDEPPPEITGQSGARVYFVRGDYTKPEALEQARVRHARRAIIVADTTIPRDDQDRDARTVLSALMIERMKPDIYTCAELLNRDNEVHLKAAGIEEVVVTSEAGGHHLALAALHHGLADVIQELMTGKMGDTLSKWPIPDDYVGLDFIDVIDRCKRERNAIVIGVEIKGQLGSRTEGYRMLLNPNEAITLTADDNLVLIAPAAAKANKAT